MVQHHVLFYNFFRSALYITSDCVEGICELYIFFYFLLFDYLLFLNRYSTGTLLPGARVLFTEVINVISMLLTLSIV